MTLDRLWAGWRTSYMDEVTADGNAGLPAEGGSVFTRILGAIDVGELTDETAYVVHRGEHAFAILNAYPYGTGHLLVMPYREVGELEDLTAGESADVWRVVPVAGGAISDVRHLVSALDDATSVAEVGLEVYPAVAGEDATLLRDEKIDLPTLATVIDAVRPRFLRATS